MEEIANCRCSAEYTGGGIDFYAGANRKVISSKYEEWIGENRRYELLSVGQNPLYINLINQAYRSGSFIGDGGTADVVRFERSTGLNIGSNNNSHVQKAKEMILYIQNKVLKQNLSDKERQNVIDILEDLQDALEGV